MESGLNFLHCSAHFVHFANQEMPLWLRGRYTYSTTNPEPHCWHQKSYCKNPPPFIFPHDIYATMQNGKVSCRRWIFCTWVTLKKKHTFFWPNHNIYCMFINPSISLKQKKQIPSKNLPFVRAPKKPTRFQVARILDTIMFLLFARLVEGWDPKEITFWKFAIHEIMTSGGFKVLFCAERRVYLGDFWPSQIAKLNQVYKQRSLYIWNQPEGHHGNRSLMGNPRKLANIDLHHVWFLPQTW